MKNIQKHIKSGLFLLAVALTGIWGCEKESFDDYAQTDLLFPQPSITRLEPSTAEVGAEVRIVGANLDKTLRVIVGSNSREAQIVSRSPGEVVFKVPRTASSGRVR
ncbi:MAG: IPT/TIG domain-containing protein, partial [Bacteroidota bacterium]